MRSNETVSFMYDNAKLNFASLKKRGFSIARVRIDMLEIERF